MRGRIHSRKLPYALNQVVRTCLCCEFDLSKRVSQFVVKTSRQGRLNSRECISPGLKSPSCICFTRKASSILLPKYGLVCLGRVSRRCWSKGPPHLGSVPHSRFPGYSCLNISRARSLHSGGGATLERTISAFLLKPLPTITQAPVTGTVQQGVTNRVNVNSCPG